MLVLDVGAQIGKIIPYLPYLNHTERGQDALLIIDIEGFEMFAFENLNRLLDNFKFRVIPTRL